MTAKAQEPWPKLSTMTSLFPRSIASCQACGADADVSGWIECDEDDRPTDVLVFLCEGCGNQVGPHPRLYLEFERNRPWPGAMSCCLTCPWRLELRCTHPLLKANGGPGLPLRSATPTVSHICGTKNGKRFCDQRVSYAAAPICDAPKAVLVSAVPPPITAAPEILT